MLLLRLPPRAVPSWHGNLLGEPPGSQSAANRASWDTGTRHSRSGPQPPVPCLLGHLTRCKLPGPAQPCGQQPPLGLAGVQSVASLPVVPGGAECVMFSLGAWPRATCPPPCMANHSWASTPCGLVTAVVMSLQGFSLSLCQGPHFMIHTAKWPGDRHKQ